MSRRVPKPSRLLPSLLLGAFALVMASSAPALAATTVDLGTAGSFAVLAGSGITNTGETTITGDIGTSPTPAETGVDPCPTAADCVVLTGSNHPADAAALQAKKDLTSAYDAAAGQSSTGTVSDIGNHTYKAGVYSSASSIGLTGEVTLDAENVGGAVFIFQAGSTLITGSNSSVRLINGASACNVFFQVGSAATLGTGSTFRGTILAHDDISLGDSVTVDGRLLGGEQESGAGAVTLIHDTITTPSCTSSGTTGGGTGTTGGSTGTTGSSTNGTGGSTGTTGTTGSSTGGSTGTAGTTGSSTTGAGTGGGATSTGTTGAGAPTTGSSSTLPVSGARTRDSLGLGLALLALGSFALLAGRRRRTAPRH
ncbi:MAG TPA: ice-binding family protein [Mycobacteriales bacterium]|nr:ice-binding family protein [Mycobacteriales bacterium]